MILMKKMLLIFGQPGIGKSTLITWIMANLIEKEDDIFVYQFASDLRNVNWQGNDILNDILKKLKLRHGELENKILVLDGFDEVRAGDDREKILNQIYRTLKGANYLKKFSLIITCRENYVYKLNVVKCDFITLQAWDSEQIQNFCETYGSISKCNITENMIDKILDNKKILGIPLILYMVLALNITIEENRGIIDVYDQIFSLERGGMYDRCIRNSEYGDEHIIISEARIKRQIHQISQKIAFWIFENNSEKAFITQKAYEEICNDVTNEISKGNEDIKRFFLIGNYFKLVKHCEGIGTDELHFVHRSIYEYFVAVYFFESVYKLKTVEEIAGKFGELLKDGQLSEQILAFIKYKFDKTKIINLPNMIKEVFQLMLRDGMTYYTGIPLLNILNREMNVFSNMLEIVCLWNLALGELDSKIILYLQFSRQNKLNLAGISLRGANLTGVKLAEANLAGANLIGADLKNADLKKANLVETDLTGTNLKGADLIEANLKRACLKGAYLALANLTEANLVGANLTSAYLKEADLFGTIFDKKQVELLHEKYDLKDSSVYVIDAIISYEDYCKNSKKRKNFREFY